MNCPECGIIMEWIDYYGEHKRAEHYYQYPQSWIDKKGDIFKCPNEDCMNFDIYYHTDLDGELREGWPC